MNYQSKFVKDRGKTENLLYYLQNKLIMVAVFLDLKGAFDNVVYRNCF